MLDLQIIQEFMMAPHDSCSSSPGSMAGPDIGRGSRAPLDAKQRPGPDRPDTFVLQAGLVTAWRRLHGRRNVTSSSTESESSDLLAVQRIKPPSAVDHFTAGGQVELT
jgi:hypothetical protein